MSNEKKEDAMEIEETPKIEPEQVVENKEEEKNEENKAPEEKQKKKIIKRAPMEKTVDETIKEFDKLLMAEVSIYIYYMSRSRILKNLRIYLKN